MRRQEKYITHTALIAAGTVSIIDMWLQNQELKKQGLQLCWETFNGFRTLKRATVGGLIGGCIGNQIYHSKVLDESYQPFSPDGYLRKLLKDEKIPLNSVQYKILVEKRQEVKDFLYDTFYKDLVRYPENTGSLQKRTAIGSTYDADIVIVIKRNNSLGPLEHISEKVHRAIKENYGDHAEVIKMKKATRLIFEAGSTSGSIDVVYGREIGDYKNNKEINLYCRPLGFWESARTFKTNVALQNTSLINKPEIREVVKILKLYFNRNHVSMENTLIEQLTLDALSSRHGITSSLADNLLYCMDYMANKLRNKMIIDEANSNNNLLKKVDDHTKSKVIDLLCSDVQKIRSNHHHVREIFYQ